MPFLLPILDLSEVLKTVIQQWILFRGARGSTRIIARIPNLEPPYQEGWTTKKEMADPATPAEALQGESGVGSATIQYLKPGTLY